MRGLKNNDLDTLTDLLTDVIFGKGLTFNVQSMPSVLTMAVAMACVFLKTQCIGSKALDICNTLTQ